MVFLWLIGLIAYLTTWILSLLPDATFLPLPDVAANAVGTVAGWFGWLIGLGGANLKSTILTVLPIVIGIEVAAFLWHIIRHWRVPLISKFTASKSD